MGRSRGPSHGWSKTPEYKSWLHAKDRCYNTACKAYYLYGARGIGMDPEWRNDFMAFIRDMGRKPSPEHSLDRINTNGDYCKENCRWATTVQQVRNRRSTVMVGETALGAIAESCGAVYSTLHKRLMDGRPLSPEIKNLCIKHFFKVNDKQMTIGEIAKLISKPYMHIYHKLITKNLPIQEVISAE